MGAVGLSPFLLLYQISDMHDLLQQYSDHPWVILAILFFVPFASEELALITGAGLAASGVISPEICLSVILSGIIISDWALYFLGHVAGRISIIRRKIGENRIEHGRQILRRGTLTAAVIARLLPWLLFPVIVASGFLRTGFAAFAIVNACIATIYATAIFLAAFRFNLAAFDVLDGWGWIAIALAMVIILMLGRFAAKRCAAAFKLDNGS